jgi:hypothetical protein
MGGGKRQQLRTRVGDFHSYDMGNHPGHASFAQFASDFSPFTCGVQRPDSS